jgi:hypothetical protein
MWSEYARQTMLRAHQLLNCYIKLWFIKKIQDESKGRLLADSQQQETYLRRLEDEREQ